MPRALGAPRSIGLVVFALVLLAVSTVSVLAQPASVMGRFHVM
jgi:hypothetical protein